MSKTHELRRKASEAKRDRNWDVAIKLYERICEQDAGNGSPRNELGDIYLKTGDVENAIAQFQEAARLYQDFGLTNNAVAVHKKILRHEPNHLHSLWVLGEIRLAQGLDAEASTAFLDFLSRADNITESERDAFVARGIDLIDKMGDDPEVLSRLDAIFAAWDQGQERAQVLVAKARLAHEAGEFEVRDKYVEHARSAFEHLEALPEYVSFRQSVDGPAGGDDPEPEVEDGSGGEDPDTIVLDDSDLPDSVIELDPGDTDPGFGSDAGELDIDLGFDFDEGELSGAVEKVSGSIPPVGAASVETNEEGEIEIPVDDDPASSIEPEEEDPAPVEIPSPDEEAPDETGPEAEGQAVVPEAFGDDAPEAQVEESPSAPTETVDLLSEILADESFDVKGAEQQQLDTIEQEMRGQIGGQVSEDDHAGQYELGIVYMDMGLFEQAAAAFDAASAGEAERLRSMEMKGTCLLRLGRNDEAMAVFQAGLAIPGYPGRSYLGLLYGVGVCLEIQDDLTGALDYFERVAAVDDGFLDVSERLEAVRGRVGDHA